MNIELTFHIIISTILSQSISLNKFVLKMFKNKEENLLLESYEKILTSISRNNFYCLYSKKSFTSVCILSIFYIESFRYEDSI